MKNKFDENNIIESYKQYINGIDIKQQSKITDIPYVKSLATQPPESKKPKIKHLLPIIAICAAIVLIVTVLIWQLNPSTPPIESTINPTQSNGRNTGSSTPDSSGSYPHVTGNSDYITSTNTTTSQTTSISTSSTTKTEIIYNISKYTSHGDPTREFVEKARYYPITKNDFDKIQGHQPVMTRNAPQATGYALYGIDGEFLRIKLDMTYFSTANSAKIYLNYSNENILDAYVGDTIICETKKLSHISGTAVYLCERPRTDDNPQFLTAIFQKDGITCKIEIEECPDSIGTIKSDLITPKEQMDFMLYTWVTNAPAQIDFLKNMSKDKRIKATQEMSIEQAKQHSTYGKYIPKTIESLLTSKTDKNATYNNINNSLEVWSYRDKGKGVVATSWTVEKTNSGKMYRSIGLDPGNKESEQSAKNMLKMITRPLFRSDAIGSDVFNNWLKEKAKDEIVEFGIEIYDEKLKEVIVVEFSGELLSVDNMLNILKTLK